MIKQLLEGKSVRGLMLEAYTNGIDTLPSQGDIVDKVYVDAEDRAIDIYFKSGKRVVSHLQIDNEDIRGKYFINGEEVSKDKYFQLF